MCVSVSFNIHTEKHWLHSHPKSFLINTCPHLRYYYYYYYLAHTKLIRFKNVVQACWVQEGRWEHLVTSLPWLLSLNVTVTWQENGKNLMQTPWLIRNRSQKRKSFFFRWQKRDVVTVRLFAKRVWPRYRVHQLMFNMKWNSFNSRAAAGKKKKKMTRWKSHMFGYVNSTFHAIVLRCSTFLIQ